MAQSSPHPMPVSKDPVQAPADREKALSAAYLRLLGATQKEAAEAAGCGERTLRQWESCSWWPEIQAEASTRWLQGLAAQARRGLEKAVATDGRLALQVLERLEPALSPARVRVGIHHTTGTLDLENATDEQLERIIAGEDPALVLAS